MSSGFLVIPLLFFICSSLFFNIINITLLYFNILIITLLYLFIFAIILFLVYHGYMLGLVRLQLYTCLGSYSVYPCVQWVNEKYCVGMVPIPYLSMIVPYMPDHGVVHGGCWAFLTSLPKVDLVF